MKMIIPTRGRPTRQKTKEWADRDFDVWLMVREDEYVAYRNAGHEKVLTLPYKVENIAQIRDYIVSITKGKFVIADDNMTVKLSRKVEATGTDDLVKDISRHLDDHPLVGVNTSFNDGFTPRGTGEELSFGYVECFFCINKKTLPAGAKFDFGGLGTTGDKHVNLSLACAGRMPAVMIRWKFVKRIWEPGGCQSMGRTYHMVTEDAKLLKKLYPDFVRLREIKQPDGGTGVTPTIYLKKAYNHALSGR